MKLRILLLLLVTMPVYTCTMAQAGKGIKEILPGETVADISIQNINRYKSPHAKLAEFYAGKLLIIDFWATYCSPCVSALPKLDSLQKKFAGSLQILPVTFQKAGTVEMLLNRMEQLRNIDLPFVVSDTLLSKYFPYRLIPQYVWINSNGKVMAITDADAVTEKNIRAVINKEVVALKGKKDDMEFNYFRPYKPLDSLIEYRSLLTKYNPSIGGGLLADPPTMYSDSMMRFFAWNAGIIDLFYIAFSKFTTPAANFKLIELRLKDSTKYIRPGGLLHSKYKTNNEWDEDNVYCYELILKQPIKSNTFYNYMFADLNRFFAIKATVEKRKIPCWIILNKSGKTDDSNKEGVSKLTWSGDTLKEMKHAKMSELVEILNSFVTGDPLLDETQIEGQVDMKFDLPLRGDDVLNIDALKIALEKNGLQLIKENRETDVLVLRDK